MTVYIELTTNPAEAGFNRNRGNMRGGARAGRSVARRPTRGQQIKPNTYATLRVIQADGTPLPLTDSSSITGKNTTGYTNFLLQQTSETRMEKQQIIETFGASYVFFFGEAPRFLDVSALVLNSQDFNWEAEFWANYNTYLRGTKLVEMGARAYLSYDDVVMEGYFMQASAVKTADAPLHVPIQFRFFVTNCHNVTEVGDPNFPIRSSIQLPASLERTAGYGQYAPGISEGFNGVYYREPGAAHRWLIAANKDEYVGFLGTADGPAAVVDIEAANLLGGEYVPNPTEGRPNTARTPQESDNLFRDAMQALTGMGAEIDSPDGFYTLGFRENKDDNQGATYAPKRSTGTGLRALAGGQFTAAVEVDEQVSLGSVLSFNNSYSSDLEVGVDPLVAVYGRGSARGTTTAVSQNQGDGEPVDYDGMRSSNDPHPGYGASGYGTRTDAAHGTANVGGDPGYRRPGEAAERGPVLFDIQELRVPAEDRTALTTGSVAGRGESVGGASVPVGGRPSLFGVTSAPGVLDPSGGDGSPTAATVSLADLPPMQPIVVEPPPASAPQETSRVVGRRVKRRDRPRPVTEIDPRDLQQVDANGNPIPFFAPEDVCSLPAEPIAPYFDAPANFTPAP